jgi:GNAT superfamily N-acetyltransferase
MKNLPEELNFKAVNTELSFRHSPLDSISLDRDVYVLHRESTIDPNENQFSSLRDWLSQVGSELRKGTILTARLETSSPTIQLLQEAGFLFTELTIHPEIENLQSREPSKVNLRVRIAKPEMARSVARNTQLFKISRFHFDHRVSNELADKRFQDWLVRAIDSKEDECIGVFDASTNQEMALFVVRREGDDVTWILTAILPAFQGKGIGIDVWNAVLSYHKLTGVKRVSTNVSAQNLRTIPLYVRTGFALRRTSLCLHFHLTEQGL